MATQCEELRLPASPEAVERACRSVLPRLGWEIAADSGSRLEAHEDPARLDCHTSPSRVRIGVEPAGVRDSIVMIECSGPGLALMVSARLRRQMVALVTRIAAATAVR